MKKKSEREEKGGREGEKERERQSESEAVLDCLTRVFYGVGTISRMPQNVGLFCGRALQKRPIFLKETYILYF